jgi:hypothetical protein
MLNIEKRIQRLEQLVTAADCICADPMDALAIVVIEDGWDEARIRAAEEAQAGVCPVHGRTGRPVLRLSGRDVDG